MQDCIHLFRELVPVVFLHRKFHITFSPFCSLIELFRHRKTVIILRTAENPKRNILFPDCRNHSFRMLLQNRDHGPCRIIRSQHTDVNAIARKSISHPPENPPHAMLSYSFFCTISSLLPPVSKNACHNSNDTFHIRPVQRNERIRFGKQS